MVFRRVIIIVLDGCGVGELPDAVKYGDSGAATLPRCAEANGGLHLPNLQRLGLGNIVPIQGVPAVDLPLGSFGKMAELSPGKDSTTGHWEMMGVELSEPFPVFPDGFPDNLVKEFERRAGVKTIGNFAASGTEIIERLGEEHLRSGAIILYTSADSVFQLAAHEDVIPVPRLYEICEVARELCTGPFNVGRVIARPFIGTPGKFERTPRRKDFSRLPESDTLLDLLVAAGHQVLAVGKIYDLFAGKGISQTVKTADNGEVVAAVLEAVRSEAARLIFANLVDFDQNWGHRRDHVAFAKGLETFDQSLAELLEILRDDDLLILTADHGVDPTFKAHTDHTREYVPLIVYSKTALNGVNLGTRRSFADLGRTLAENFDLFGLKAGQSFLSQIVP